MADVDRLAYRRIVLATEHGEFDVGAERLAIEAASAMNASLHVVVVVISNPEFEAQAPELAARADEQAASAVAELVARAQAQGIQCSQSVRHADDIADVFADEAQRVEADLLVVRRRGRRSWLSRLLVGEMVSRLIDHSPCDLLIAPRAAQGWPSGVAATIDILRDRRPRLLAEQEAFIGAADGAVLVCLVDPAR